MSRFKKATRKQLKLRAALVGPTGSGKTKTALKMAKYLGTRIAVIDTENRSASKYVGDPDVPEFDVLELDSYAPLTYVEAIKDAEREGYDVIVIDGITQAWSGKDGALEQVDRAAKRSQSGNTFTAWRDVTPQHTALVEALVQCRAHLIVTMRAKMEYTLDELPNGKKTPRKIGLAPVQRDGMEYEFDVVGDIDVEHNLIISKTRCSAIDGAVFHKPGRDVAEVLLKWLDEGEAVDLVQRDEYGLEVPRSPCPTFGPRAIPKLRGKRWDVTEGGWQVQQWWEDAATRAEMEKSPAAREWAPYVIKRRAARKAAEADEAARAAHEAGTATDAAAEGDADLAAEQEAAERALAARDDQRGVLS